ncbi:MAG TPA: hypothetical protein VEX87_22870, partial [Skermanella sp.]|nr:hypothetical protein [Skermanella sp.]
MSSRASNGSNGPNPSTSLQMSRISSSSLEGLSTKPLTAMISRQMSVSSFRLALSSRRPSCV